MFVVFMQVGHVFAMLYIIMQLRSRMQKQESLANANVTRATAVHV